MSEISTTLTLGQLGIGERALAKFLPSTVDKMLGTMAERAVTIMRDIALHRDLLFTGVYMLGWQAHKLREMSHEASNSTIQASVIEFGRVPGTQPPVDALRPWAQAKLGNANLAWPVARAIKRRGMKARPVLFSREGQAKLRTMVDKVIREQTDALMRKAYKP